jgi:hypothetical protein
MPDMAINPTTDSYEAARRRADVDAQRLKMQSRGITVGGDPGLGQYTPPKTPTQGIAQGVGANGERAFGDAAARTAAPRAGVVSRAATGAASRVGNLVRGAGESALPLVAAGSAIDSFSRPTEDYYNRLGLDPKTVGENGFKDIAARTVGVASDLGASVLDTGLAPVNFARQFAGAQPLRTFSSIVQAGDNPAPRPAQAPPAAGQPQAIAAPASQNSQNSQTSQAPQAPAIYRNGNNFSDQPNGGKPYTPGGNNLTVVPSSFFTGSGIAGPAQPPAGTLDGRARQAQDFAASTATENSISQRNAATENARRARQAAGSLRLVRGGRTQRQLLGDAADFDNKAVEAQGRIGTNKDFIRTPEQEQALTLGAAQAEQQNGLTQQQAIAQGLQNQAAQRQQAVIDQIGTDPNSGNRRGLIDSLLISQGKDPDAQRFQAIESVGGNDAFPIKTRSLYDTRTGQIIGGSGTGQGATQQPTEYAKGQIYKDAQGRSAKWDGEKFVPVN